MFIGEVDGLDIISPEAESEFPYISADSYMGGDKSLLATMRCILPGHVPDGESVYGAVTSVLAGGDSAHERFARVMDRVSVNRTNCLSILSVSGSEDFCTKFLETFDDQELLAKLFPGYAHLKQVEDFFQSSKILSRIMVNRDLNSTVILVSNMGLRWFHTIQTFLPLYFPKFFPEKNYTDEEKDLLKALTKRDIQPYIAAVQKFEAKYDFRAIRIRGMLTGFERNLDDQAIAVVEHDIESFRNQIDSYLTNIASCYRNIEDAMIRKNGLIQKRMSRADEEGELIQYAVRNKSLDIVCVMDGDIRFIVRTYLDNFDPDVFERYFQKEDSFLFLDNNGYEPYRGMSPDDWRLFLKAVFHDEIFKIRVCAAYHLDFNTGNFGGISNYTFPDSCATYVPNYHIQEYHCLGGNEDEISAAMIARDFVGAIEACVASAKNINLTDFAVVQYFCRDLCRSMHQCVELPDGQVVKPKDAVAWLKESKEEAE